MIAGTFVRALPSWLLWLALTALVAASAGWGYTRGLSAEREARDDLAAAFAQFRSDVAAQGRQAQTRTAAEITRQETINAQTHTAYGVALDRLRALHAADRMRRPAAGTACAGSGGVPEAPASAGGAAEATADTGSDRPGVTAAEDPTLAERCARTTLQCLYLQDWAERSADAGGD